MATRGHAVGEFSQIHELALPPLALPLFQRVAGHLHFPDVKLPVRFLDEPTLIVGNGTNELPVEAVVEAGATDRKVTFPEGANWIDIRDDKTYAGGTSATVSAPLDEIPLFAKEGAIIPHGPLVEYVDQKPVNPINLPLYQSPGPTTEYAHPGHGRRGQAVSCYRRSNRE